MTNTDRLTAALAELLSRESAGAFVIVRDGTSGKFLQFAGSSSEPLLFDLPLQALNRVDAKRATAFFREKVIAVQEARTFDRPGGQCIGTQLGYTVSFGADVEAAVSFALEVFTRVYWLPPDFDLVLEEN